MLVMVRKRIRHGPIMILTLRFSGLATGWYILNRSQLFFGNCGIYMIRGIENILATTCHFWYIWGIAWYMFNDLAIQNAQEIDRGW